MVQITVIEKQKAKKSWEQLISEGMVAREQGDQSSWLKGDLANEVETYYGEDSLGKYAYAIGVVKKTLMNERTIAKTFKPEIREKYRKLSFSHFRLLTGVEKPEAWLEEADDNDWSVEKLNTELRKAYDEVKIPNLEDEPPKVIRCPQCGLWRLKGISAFEICKGHYVFEKGKLEYR